jgi:type IV pilus assembly protein PilX
MSRFHIAPPKRQQGVLLVIVLIMLMVLSVLGSVAIRGASSGEEVANQSRLRSLGQQTAEAALAFCENQVRLYASNPANGFKPEDVPSASGAASYLWETMNNWDSGAVPPTNAYVKVVAITSAGDANGNKYFTRSPECMSQYVEGGGGKTIVTTARGFGPEVSVRDGTAPKGTEVWLQSVIQLN